MQPEFPTENLENNMLAARSELKSRFDLFSETLPMEVELFEMWEDKENVVISIACATFNHGALLEDAIKSFLFQKTSFRFEIVIRDDASTDGTRDLIAYYMHHYPRIIRAQIYDDNQFKLGRRPADDWFELTIGKYIALCEGDDFWIDRDKLQDQVSQLERCPECVISVAGTLWYNRSKDTLLERGILSEERVYSEMPPQYHHTSTLVIKRKYFGAATERRRKYKIYGDTALRWLLTDYGKCICLPRLVSVYWIDNTGIWTSLSADKKAKDHLYIFWGLIRAVKVRKKLRILPSFLGACTKYFPISLRNKEWNLAVACLIPFFLTKTRNLSLRVLRRFSSPRES